jgi:integrase
MFKDALDTQQLTDGGDVERITLREALDRFIAPLEGSYRLDRERDRDKILGLHQWRDRGRFSLSPDKPLETLCSADVSRLRAARLQEGMAKSSINSEVRMLQRAYNLARTEWGVVVAPVVLFPVYKVKPKTRRLDAEEELRLLAELDPAREVPTGDSEQAQAQRQDAYDLMVTLLDTGCRIMEASTLQWSQVNLQERYITFVRDKVETEGLMYMTDRLYEVLLRRRAGTEGHLYVFTAYKGGRPLPRKPRGYAISAIRKAIKRAGLNEDPLTVERFGRFTPHGCRDTFTSRLIERGLSKRGAQTLLGHKTSSMTDKYTHLEERDVATKAAKLLS